MEEQSLLLHISQASPTNAKDYAEIVWKNYPIAPLIQILRLITKYNVW